MATLKQITLRGIPDKIEKIIKKEAEKKGISLNKAFISVLEQAAGTKAGGKKKKTLYHDLDHLFGAWSREEAKSFQENLELQRGIDEDLWKKTG